MPLQHPIHYVISLNLPSAFSQLRVLCLGVITFVLFFVLPGCGYISVSVVHQIVWGTCAICCLCSSFACFYFSSSNIRNGRVDGRNGAAARLILVKSLIINTALARIAPTASTTTF